MDTSNIDHAFRRWLHLGPGLIFTATYRPNAKQHIRVHVNKDVSSDHTFCGRLVYSGVWGDMESDVLLDDVCRLCLNAMQLMTQAWLQSSEHPDGSRRAGWVYEDTERVNHSDWAPPFWKTHEQRIAASWQPICARLDSRGEITVADVVAQLDLSEDRVRRLAVALGVGRKHGRDWLFSAADIAAMRARNTQRGRPAVQQ